MLEAPRARGVCTRHRERADRFRVVPLGVVLTHNRETPTVADSGWQEAENDLDGKFHHHYVYVLVCTRWQTLALRWHE